MTSFPKLRGRGLVAIDLETTALQWWSGEIFGVAVSYGDQDHYWDVRDTPDVLRWMRDEVPGLDRLCNHNIKFDALFMRKYDIRLPPWDRVECTMVRAALIYEHHLSYDLDYIGKQCIQKGKDANIWQELADLFGGKPTKNVQIRNLQRAPAPLVKRYATMDTRVAHSLCLWQDGEIEKQDLYRVLELEKRLLPVLVDLEWQGVRIDVKAAERAVTEVKKEIKEKQATLDKMAGFAVNPNPSGSIHRLFAPRQGQDGQWRMADGTPLETTPAGRPSINSDALRRSRLPEAGLVLDVRQLLKLSDTFLSGHVLGHQVNGVIHCNFNQTKGDNDRGTGPGRLSIDSPALQQIPKRNKRISEIVRTVFIPDEDHVWVSSDWSQFEVRWFAHYARNRQLIDALCRDPRADPHQVVADITGLPRDSTPEIKGNAKQINLGLIFGMGEGRMASEMGLPYTVERNASTGVEYLRAGPEAQAIFRRYHEHLPGIRSYLDRASSIARTRGFVITAGGRHIRFPHKFGVHKAGGLILQGSAADAIKWKMVELHAMGAEPMRVLLTIHDDVNSSVYQGAADYLIPEIRRVLEAFGPKDRLPVRVPIISVPQEGANWWEASKKREKAK